MHRLSDIDESKQVAILALINLENKEEIVGVGRCFLEQQGASAEIIITVRDDYYKKGVGKVLFSHLISLVRKRGSRY